MNAATFGAYPGAQALAELLAQRNDPTLQKKVSRTLQDFNEGLRQLETLADEHYRGRLALLWRDEFLRQVSIDPEIDKFVRNVLTTNAKRLLAPENA